MDIIKSLLENNINHLVYEKELEKSLFVEKTKAAGIESISVLDARSAVYYATGMCAQNKEMVVVCIDSINSRSAFSGMTEAYYRKLPVILVTFGKALDYSKELRDVVASHYICSFDTNLNEILKDDYPMHIELTNVTNKTEQLKSNQLLPILANILCTDDYLYIGQRIDAENQNFVCKVIKGGLPGSIDGALSNVLGASLAKIRKRYIGLVSEMEFLHDMNALGNINMHDLVFYFVIVKKKNEAICNYAKNLGFEVIWKAKELIEEKQVFQALNNGKKTIFMVCEE